MHFLLTTCSTCPMQSQTHTQWLMPSIEAELESEIRLLVTTRGTVTLIDFTFRKDSDREALMEKIESIHSQTIYHHHDCTPDCKKVTNFGSERSSTIVVVKIPRCGESQNIIIYMYFFAVGCGTLSTTHCPWRDCWVPLPHSQHTSCGPTPL